MTGDINADSARLALLTKAMETLPLGLIISDSRSGDRLYANASADRLEAEPLRDGIVVARHQVTSASRLYEIMTLTDLSDQHANEARLVHMAFYDDLTGLPKSALMKEIVDRMILDDVPSFALSFIDVDNFKFINDYYGHDIGDRLLRKLTNRIADNCQLSDLVARVGGDEFVLLTTSGSDEQIERISERLRAPFFIEGFEIFTSASIGVSVYPLHGESYEKLRANADRAMYRAKESAKGGVKRFDASLNVAASSRMEAEQQLRLAIRDQSFVCAFQPKVDFRDGTIVGVEVLLRWRDGSGVLHPPGDLLKLASELGLMDQITMIVVDQVIDQVEQIDEVFGRQASISINVAAKQTGDFAFMQKLTETLAETPHAQRFILELTEEAFFAKGEFQRDVLPLLRGCGIGVSIDDFGVGYSSLSALAEIAADEVKVDRSFITEIHLKERSQTILKVIEMLGRELGMRIVVEGVETDAELDYLRTHTDIRCGQGYLFARPMFLRGGRVSGRGARQDQTRRVSGARKRS